MTLPADIPGNLWDDMRAYIRRNHPRVVRGWFAQLSLGAFDGGDLTIQTGNEAQRRYLERQARCAFVEAAQAVTGRLVTVTFQTVCHSAGRQPRGAETPIEGGWSSPRDSEYTFENFISGPDNRLALAGAIAVADECGGKYSPLVICGSSGLGKTHLLQAISALLAANGEHSAEYLTGQLFVARFMQALEGGNEALFRHHYRHGPGLILDDIQYLAGRERSQEEFFHVFNLLHDAGKVIVVSADQWPAEVSGLAERLVSRLSGGLVTQLDVPCLETRIALLRSKARLRAVELPDEVAVFIAERWDGNGHRIEMLLGQLDVASGQRSGRIDVDLARRVLDHAIPGLLPIRSAFNPG